MFIQTEATPNPATLKFLPGRAVLETGTLDMRDTRGGRAIAAGRAAVRHPERRRRVLRLRLHHRHQDRRRMAAAQAGDPRRHHGALHVRRAAARGGDGERAAAATSSSTPSDAETVATIKDLIETRVRPAVASDGGDITFRGYKEGVVYLHMKGACSGCPSSTATLKHGIQNLLRAFRARRGRSAADVSVMPSACRANARASSILASAI